MSRDAEQAGTSIPQTSREAALAREISEEIGVLTSWSRFPTAAGLDAIDLKPPAIALLLRTPSPPVMTRLR